MNVYISIWVSVFNSCATIHIIYFQNIFITPLRTSIPTTAVFLNAPNTKFPFNTTLLYVSI